jgi:hypothetical protein
MAKRQALVNLATGKVTEIQMGWEPPENHIAVYSEVATIGWDYIDGELRPSAEQLAIEAEQARIKAQSIEENRLRVEREAKEAADAAQAKAEASVEILAKKEKLEAALAEISSKDELGAVEEANKIILEQGIAILAKELA